MKAFLFVFALLVCTPSCSLFQSACAETAASRSSASVLIADAQAALEQAEVVVNAITSEDVRARATMALGAAQSALRAAASTLAGASEVCSGFDIASAFSEFKSAWQALAPFLSLLGGHGESSVRPPIVVGQ